MAKILSVKEKRLQKKLVPLNIFVCILSLIAIISLYFAPVIKVDIGKILRQEQSIALIDEYMDTAVKEGIGDENSGVDIVPVVGSVVKEVVTKTKGSVSFSALKITQLALVQSDDKLGLVINDLTDDGGVVQQLIDSIVKAVRGMFEKPDDDSPAAINGVIEDAMVNVLVSSLGQMLPEDEAQQIREKLTDEKVDELKTTFRQLDTVKSEQEVITVVDTFIGQVSEALGEDYISPEDEQAVKDFVLELYNDTVAEVEKTPGAKLDMEAMICVAVSQNVNLDEIDISKMLEELLGESSGSEKTPERKALTEGESEPEPPVEPETPAEPETPVEPEPPADKSVPLTYPDLLGEMGLGEDELDNLSDNLRTVLNKKVNESIGGVKEELSGLGWIYDYIYWLILAVMVFFILPWLFLALISFFKIFAKNKRFMTWYVKLYSFIPGLIALALMLAPLVAPKILPLLKLEADSAEILSYINIACAGVSSFTWVSGLCFVALWLVSIFWAFPIKHKIRKERKACKRAKKNGTYRYDEFEDTRSRPKTQTASAKPPPFTATLPVRITTTPTTATTAFMTARITATMTTTASKATTLTRITTTGTMNTKKYKREGDLPFYFCYNFVTSLCGISLQNRGILIIG